LLSGKLDIQGIWANWNYWTSIFAEYGNEI
jgi:hypothetical protein